MLDVIATVAGVLNVALAGVQVYYARLQVKQQSGGAAGALGDGAAESLGLARPWRPGWVQLVVGSSLVGIAIKGLESDSGWTYDPPSDGLSAAMLVLGLLSAAPTAVYQASLPLAVPRILFGTLLFLTGAYGGYLVLDKGAESLAVLLTSTVMVSAIAYGARSQPGWQHFWKSAEDRFNSRRRLDSDEAVSADPCEKP